MATNGNGNNDEDKVPTGLLDGVDAEALFGPQGAGAIKVIGNNSIDIGERVGRRRWRDTRLEVAFLNNVFVPDSTSVVCKSETRTEPHGPRGK